MAYGRRAIYRKRNGRTRKTTLRRAPLTKYKPKQRTIGGFKPQGGTSIPRGVFPLSIMKKLRYCDTISMNPAAANRVYHAFRCNNIYDPDLTGTGHQPRGFDQMALFYNHYSVVGSKITVRYIPTVAKSTNSTPSWLWVTTSTSSDPLASEAVDSTLWEGGMWKNRTVVRGGDDNNTIKIPTTSASFSAKKFFKCKSIVGNTPYRAAVTGAPTEEAYFTIYTQSCAPSTDAPSYDFEVTVDYIVVFTEPKQIGTS